MEVWDRRNSGWGVGSEKFGLGGWSRGVGSGELRVRRVGIEELAVRRLRSGELKSGGWS